MSERDRAFNEFVQRYRKMHPNFERDVHECGGLEKFAAAAMAAAFNEALTWAQGRLG